MTQKKMRRVVEIFGALEYFSGQKSPEAPLVKGNLGYLPLSFRVMMAQKGLQPLMEAYNESRKPLLEECKLPLEEGETLKHGEMKVDFAKLTELSKPILDEEVNMPDLKPLTWQLFEKAQLSVDPVILFMLGDFLEGEPPGLLDDKKPPAM